MTKKETRKRFAEIRAMEKKIRLARAVISEVEKELASTCPFRVFQKIQLPIGGKLRKAVITHVSFGMAKGVAFHHNADCPWKLTIVPYKAHDPKELLSLTQGQAYVYADDKRIVEGKVIVLDEPHTDEAKEYIRKQWNFIGKKAPVFPDEVPPAPVPEGYVLLGRGPLKVPGHSRIDFGYLAVLHPATSVWFYGCAGITDRWYAAKKGTKIARLNLAAGKEESK